MERQRHRSRLLAYGREQEFRLPKVPAAATRDHLVQLMKHAGLERIADAAQVSRSIVLDIYFGPRGAEKRHREKDPASRTVLATVAAQILALTPDDVDARLVPSLGTERRLQALVAVGYTESELATRLGMNIGNFNGLILGRRSRVTSGTHETTRQVFKELWAKPSTGTRAAASRRLAQRHGWVGPLSWDDIDDPAETPNLEGNPSTEDEPLETEDIDEARVYLATVGEAVRLTSPELREAIRRLVAARLNDKQIAERLHCADRTVLRIRQELGLAAVVGSDKRPVDRSQDQARDRMAS
jgi:DNA-binding CsgD family transcriptional regulator